MGLFLGFTNGLGAVNSVLLTLGRWLGAVGLGLMVVAILTQVFFRYVLGNALPWPEEASRFLMLWSTGLMAPSAFRRGGFVAIDMLVRLLPGALATGLSILMLALIVLVLSKAQSIGWSEVTGLGGRFELDALRVPVSLDLSVWMKLPKASMMAAMLVGVTLLLLVSVELLLRNVYILFCGLNGLHDIPETIILGSGTE